MSNHSQSPVRLVRSLPELAEVINREAEQAISDVERATALFSSGLLHALEAGKALHEAQGQIEGRWGEWVERNLTISKVTADRWIRLHVYRDHLDQSDERLTIATAFELVQDLPHVRTRYPNASPVEQIEIQRLHDAGMPKTEIAKTLGIPVGTVRWRLMTPAEQRADSRKKNAASKVRRQKAAAARKALKREEDRKAMARIGGDTAIAYEHIRKALVAADSLLAVARDAEERQYLSQALSALNKAEYAIVAANRLRRRDVA